MGGCYPNNCKLNEKKKKKANLSPSRKKRLLPDYWAGTLVYFVCLFVFLILIKTLKKPFKTLFRFREKLRGPLDIHSLLHYQYLLPEWNICCKWWPYIHSMLQFTLCVVHSVGLDKYIIICMHRYGIMESVFTALKISSSPSNHPSACPTHKPLRPLIVLLSL